MLSFGHMKLYHTDSYDGHIFLTWFGNKSGTLTWQEKAWNRQIRWG